MARTEQQVIVFNTAVELNDIAISLIERGCYRPAMETLRDATSIMKNCCCIQPTQHLSSGENITQLPIQHASSNLDFLQCKLKNAIQKLWQSQQSLESNKSKNRRVSLFRVIAEDEDSATVAHCCEKHGVTRGYQGGLGLDQTFILIRLCRVDDMNEILTTTTKTEMAAKATAIVYNYSIASRCLASGIARTHSHRQKLENQAFTALKIAFANTLNDQDGICSDTNMFNRALVLMLLMLHQLIDCSYQLGDDRHFQEYSTCLHKLQRWISVFDDMQSTILTHASAA